MPSTNVLFHMCNLTLFPTRAHSWRRHTYALSMVVVSLFSWFMLIAVHFLRVGGEGGRGSRTMNGSTCVWLALYPHGGRRGFLNCGLSEQPAGSQKVRTRCRLREEPWFMRRLRGAGLELDWRGPCSHHPLVVHGLLRLVPGTCSEFLLLLGRGRIPVALGDLIKVKYETACPERNC